MSLPRTSRQFEKPRHSPCRGFAFASNGERLKLSSVRDVVEAAAKKRRNCSSGFSEATFVPFSANRLLVAEISTRAAL
jgi:hypothetical protein